MSSFAWIFPLLVWLLPISSFKPEVRQKKLKVFIFLSETCPICQSSTLEIRRVRADFPSVNFVGVFPGKDSDDASRRKFSKKYQLDFPMEKDSMRYFTQKFKAKVTPEVVLVDESNQILYRGKIDNSYLAPGRKRAVVTEKYLHNALKALSLNQIPSPFSTDPVGCFIE